jgi:hypothetical protein
MSTPVRFAVVTSPCVQLPVCPLHLCHGRCIPSLLIATACGCVVVVRLSDRMRVLLLLVPVLVLLVPVRPLELYHYRRYNSNATAALAVPDYHCSLATASASVVCCGVFVAGLQYSLRCVSVCLPVPC